MAPRRLVDAALLLLVAALPLSASAVPHVEGADSGPQVSLSLAELDRLRLAEQQPSVTVVDTLRVAGSFRARDLTLTISGRSSGRLPAAPILGGAEVRVYGCEGDAILSRAAGGQYQLTPLAPRFALRCRLASTGSDRLQLVATASVLWVESEVADGEFVASDEADGGRAFSVVRVTASAGTVKPTATARYRLTLHPEETRFVYQLEVRNPNRAHHPFDVTLGRGEHVQQVDARANYEVDGARLRFDLPPGESTLVLSGTLPGTGFVPPVEASVHYLLLEAHPLLRPLASGAARRISPAETGLAAQFRGAQAFLLAGTETLGWTVQRLEALRTTSFALRRADHRFFITADGTAMGEAELAIDNQGAPDMAVPMDAEPTYASLQGEPMLLTRNDRGALWMPLAQGNQQVLLQHTQPLRQAWGFALGQIHLPRLPVPASQTSVELRYPRQWVPLYESFAPDGRMPMPGVGTMLGFLLLLAWTERVLKSLGLGLRRRLVLATALCLGGHASSALAAALLLANGGASVLWVVAAVRSGRIAAWKLLVGGLLLGGAGSLVLLALVFGGSNRAEFASSAGVLGEGSYTRKVAAWDEKPAAARPEPAYQGLPARFEMPAGERQSRFAREMLRADDAPPVQVLLLSGTAVRALETVVALLALLWAALQWRALRDGTRALVAGATDARAPSARPATPVG